MRAPNPAESREDAIARVRDLADNLSERYDHREHWVETVAAIRTVLALLDSEGAVAEGERAEGWGKVPQPLTEEERTALNEDWDDCWCQWSDEGFQQDDNCAAHAALEIIDHWTTRGPSAEAELARLREALARAEAFDDFDEVRDVRDPRPPKEERSPMPDLQGERARCPRCKGPAFTEQGPAGATYSAPCDCWRTRPAPTEGEAGEGGERCCGGNPEATDCYGCPNHPAFPTQSGEAERLREAFYACDEALHWIGDNYPAAMDKMPTGLFQRLQQSAAALTPTERN